MAEYRSGGDPRWLSYLGSSGTGKSMLAKIIARLTGDAYRSESITKLNPSPIYYWPNIAKAIRDHDWSWGERMIADEVAIIDDIGAENMTPAVTAELCRILENRKRKWTVVTSNLRLDQIAQKRDTRIASRLNRDRNVICQFEALDYSLRKHKKRN